MAKLSVRTGRMQFDDDWPGVFIRGDDALGFAGALRTLLHGAEKHAFEVSGTESMNLSRFWSHAGLGPKAKIGNFLLA